MAIRARIAVIILIIIVVIAACYIHIRHESWKAALRDSFCNLASIRDLERPLRCMQTGDESTAQKDAMDALTKASGCDPVDFSCWKAMMEAERSRRGFCDAMSTLFFLRDWCVPPDGILGPPALM